MAPTYPKLNLTLQSVLPGLAFLCIWLGWFFLSLTTHHAILTWVINGDDPYVLTAAINPTQFLNSLTNFTGQYRPLTYLTFSFHRLLLPHSTHLFLFHYLLLSLVPTLFYYLIKDKHRILNILLTSTLLLTPIFIYHFYTIAALTNTLSLIFLLLTLLTIKTNNLTTTNKSIILTLLVILGMLSKESFIVTATASMGWIITNYWKHRTTSLLIPFTVQIILTLTYIWFRITQYVPTDENYTFIFTSQQLVDNLSHLSAWIAHWPKGWQYGAPLRNTVLSAPTSLITLSLLFISWLLALRSRTTLTVALSGLIVISLLPYLFLNRVLVFYLDISFILLLIIIKLAQNSLADSTRKLSHLLIIAWFIAIAASYLFIHPQWLEYSFVARSHQAAQSYLKTVNSVDASSYSSICILNHHQGLWATQNGQLYNHLNPSRTKTIYSTSTNQLPAPCNSQSLILRNDSWEYEIIH